jgi:phage gpG-like protein
LKVELHTVVRSPKSLQRLVDVLGPRVVLEAIGMRMARWINDNFEAEGLEKKWKPLALSTIQQRGPGKILQDKGILKQSFGYEVHGTSEVWIGSKMQAAVWHHEGTAPYTIRVQRARVLAAQMRGGKYRFFGKEVQHPGLASRPLIPTKATAGRVIGEMLNAMVEKAIGKD